MTSSGFRGHLQRGPASRSRLHRCAHPCGLRRSRPGRPAGGQQTSCCAHPRRRLVTIQAAHDPQKPGPAAIAAQLVEQFLDSETSMTG